jgi:hypothetical protein
MATLGRSCQTGMPCWGNAREGIDSDDAARFCEKRSVPIVRFRRNARRIQLKIVLSFYGRKMQPIQSRAIKLLR